MWLRPMHILRGLCFAPGRSARPRTWFMMASVDRITYLAKRYTLVEGDLYRRGTNGILMRCITREEGCELLVEVVSAGTMHLPAR
jgi:hypothetical protein